MVRSSCILKDNDTIIPLRSRNLRGNDEMPSSAAPVGMQLSVCWDLFGGAAGPNLHVITGDCGDEDGAVIIRQGEGL